MNPVALTINGLEIRWYSIFILIAVVVSYMFMEHEAVHFKVKKDFIFNMMFWALIFGIVGARLYYVIFNFYLYSDDYTEIFRIWDGGLAIHGGLIFGFITIALYCKKYNVRLIRIMDFITVPLLLAQAIGRWGNFFNQEAHGAQTTAETLRRFFVPEFVIKGMTINDIVYFPSFYFESMICLVAFVVLLIVRRGKYVKVGTMTALYLMIYGILRFFIEMGRTDSLMLGAFKMAQIVSVIMFIIGLLMIMVISRKGKFEDLYNDPENVSEIKF